MVALAVGLGVAVAVALAELLHLRRVRRLARLAFGPGERAAPWAWSAPITRSVAAGLVAWGLIVLLGVKPKVYEADSTEDAPERHLLLVLDVSPSMRLVDAGPDHKVSRRKRASDLLKSFFQRVPIEQYRMSIVACYNGAKPVVQDTKDMEVVRNVLEDLPMEYAFLAGKTDLFAGLDEAARIAQPWEPKSTLLVAITDGDTVPPTGMPKLPASISGVLVVGVGDPRVGTFINGHMSRQDVATLRQVATRLGGSYHDGNEKHLPSDLLAMLAAVPRKGPLERLSLRDYALMAVGLGAATLALLPVLLNAFGTSWRPGVRAARTHRRDSEILVPEGVRIG